MPGRPPFPLSQFPRARHASGVDGAPRRFEDASPPWSYVWLGGLAVLAVVMLATFSSKHTGRALSDLPEAERRVLYERTMETLRTACRSVQSPDLEQHCREEAAFVTRFAECDGTCRELAAQFAPRPSR